MTEGIDSNSTAMAAGITASYRETESQRILEFTRGSNESVDPEASAGSTVVHIAQNQEGYAMLAVRLDGEELERYYGFDMALDHVAELFGISPHELPVPEAAADMGM